MLSHHVGSEVEDQNHSSFHGYQQVVKINEWIRYLAVEPLTFQLPCASSVTKPDHEKLSQRQLI